MTGDLNTLRYKPTLEEGTIVDWFAEFYHHKMREVLDRVHESHIEEAGFHSMKKEVNSLDKRYGFIKGANWLLNHLKTKIKEG